MTSARYDAVTINTAKRTPEGFIQDTPVLTRTGIFEYADPTKPDGIRRELRHPEDVFAPEHLASMRGKPITCGHVQGLEAGRSDSVIGPDGLPWRAVGSMLGCGVADEAAGVVRGDISVHHVEAVDKQGLRQLSLGYSLDYDATPGEWQGQRYDGRQRNLRVSHVAFVKQGRAGIARINMDSADDIAFAELQREPFMTQVRLDSGISYEVPPEVAAAMQKTRDDLAVAVARADTAQATADSNKAALDRAAAQHEAAVTQLRQDARNRCDMEDVARSMGITELPAQDRDLRIAVISKVNADGIDCTGKSDDYVSAAYDMAIAAHSRQQRNDNARQQQTPPATGVKPPADAVQARQDAFDACNKKLTEAWRS